jgi:hypothetical protein
MLVELMGMERTSWKLENLKRGLRASLIGKWSF